jgi:predicted nuclease of predicted toxin-antitoxin system
MAMFLANENVPGDAVKALRLAGFDVEWIRERSPGISDSDVLELSRNERRVLITFDKDFGELTFRAGHTASSGIVLFRPRLRSPAYLARLVVAVLTQSRTWEGHFCVASDSRIRVVPLPS